MQMVWNTNCKRIILSCILSLHTIKFKISWQSLTPPWTLPEAFISIKRKLAFYYLRNISWFLKSFTTMSVKTIIQSFVTSKLDYCNGLLNGSPSSSRKRGNISSNFAERHMPPIKLCIDNKLLIYVYEALFLPIWLTYLQYTRRQRT